MGREVVGEVVGDVVGEGNKRQDNMGIFHPRRSDSVLGEASLKSTPISVHGPLRILTPKPPYYI